MAYGIMLHRTGWLVHYLGTDIPISELAQVVADTRPDLAVLAAVTPSRYLPQAAALTRVAAVVPLGLAGAGATQAIAAATGARHLAGDPVTEAHQAQNWAI
jgi:cobalamin-dependent methionine synthase I